MLLAFVVGRVHCLWDEIVAKKIKNKNCKGFKCVLLLSERDGLLEICSKKKRKSESKTKKKHKKKKTITIIGEVKKEVAAIRPQGYISWPSPLAHKE